MAINIAPSLAFDISFLGPLLISFFDRRTASMPLISLGYEPILSSSLSEVRNVGHCLNSLSTIVSCLGLVFPFGRGQESNPLSASSKPVGTVLFHHFELVESPSQSGRVLIWESLIHCSLLRASMSL